MGKTTGRLAQAPCRIRRGFCKRRVVGIALCCALMAQQGALPVYGQELEISSIEKVEDGQSQGQEVPAVDFAYYQGVNADVYAWIYYPGTGVINYPILQSVSDQEFYLHHDWQGQESFPGSIFSQIYNKKNFTDFLTVLYGHNMRDESMFGSLRRLEGSNIMWDSNTIYICLPELTLQYHIFAAYVNDSYHLLYHFNQDDEETCQKHLEKTERMCEGISTFDRERFDTLTPESHILALSTCYRGDPEHRFIVQAVLDETDEVRSWLASEEQKELEAKEKAWQERIRAARRRRAAIEKEMEEKKNRGEGLPSDGETEAPGLDPSQVNRQEPGGEDPQDGLSGSEQEIYIGEIAIAPGEDG